MIIRINNLCFSYNNNNLFKNLNLELKSSVRPLVLLGPSGSGKTTLLKLLASLIKPDKGIIEYSVEENIIKETPRIGFMFQESRLLPWINIQDNIMLPLKKEFKGDEALKRTQYFLSMVKLDDKTHSYPDEISGGQAQRVSMARAFAWPAPVLFMDEPFQSMDLSLKLYLMNTTLSFLEQEKRLLLLVSHDPREAVYLGSRILILGKPDQGIIYDEYVNLSQEERNFYSLPAIELERKLVKVLEKL